MYDPRIQVIAAVHGMARYGGEQRRPSSGCGKSLDHEPRDVIVGIGPSIGPCFEVGEEVVEAAREGLGEPDGIDRTGETGRKVSVGESGGQSSSITASGVRYSY